MFEQNIEALEKKNPELAKKIKGYGTNKVRDIEVYESESKNFIISYRGVLLHSNEDPLRETKSVWHKTVTTELGEKDIQVVYGLGLGYLFKRAYVSANSRILLFEPSMDILRFVFENVGLAAEISDNRVFITQSIDEVKKFFEEKYLPGDKVEVLFLPSYLNVPGYSLLDFSNVIYKIVKDKNIDQNTIFKMAKYTINNLISRIKKVGSYKPVNILADSCKGKTALLINAGPSLKDDIELIKKHRDEFVTIAILPVVPLLLDNGIEPDFVTVVDPMDQSFKIESHKDKLKNLNLVMESRASAFVDELETKSKFVYFPFVDRVSDFILNSVMVENPAKALPATPSVAIMSFELAKLLGCSKLIFSGLDLAFTNNKIYAQDSVVLEQKQGNRAILGVEGIGTYSVQTSIVKSADGSEVETREDYLLFIREFERLAKENPHLDLVNTATKGALIAGMKYVPMAEVVGTLSKAEFDVDSLLKSFEGISLKQFQDKAVTILSDVKLEFEDFKPKLNSAILALTGLLNELEMPAPDIEKFQELFNENAPVFLETRNFLTNNFLLAAYLQAEIADFINNYNKDTQVTLQKLQSNLKVELDLLQKTREHLETLLEVMDKAV